MSTIDGLVLDAKIPAGPIEERWDSYKFDAKLVNPANKRQVRDHRRGHRPGRAVGRGHAGRARLQGEGLHLPRLAAAGPLHRRPGRHQRGQELPRRRRQHLPPLLRHGEGRRLPLPRVQRVPAGRGVASTSSTSASPRACPSPGSTAACSTTARFGGAQVSRTFYARGQTGQQLLLGAYQALAQQVGSATSSSTPAPRCSTSSWSTAGAPASSSATSLTGEITSHSAHAVVLATGGYSNAFFLSTNAMACNVTAGVAGAPARARCFANPCFTQIHPTCIPQSDEFQSKLTLMSESLRNDGRIWVPKNPDDTRPPDQIPEDDRDYFLERQVPELRQPRAARHRQPRRQGDGRQRPAASAR